MGGGGCGTGEVGDEDDDVAFVLYLSCIGEVISFHLFHRVKLRAPHA